MLVRDIGDLNISIALISMCVYLLFGDNVFYLDVDRVLAESFSAAREARLFLADLQCIELLLSASGCSLVDQLF